MTSIEHTKPAVKVNQFWLERDPRFTRQVRIIAVGGLYVHIITVNDDGSAKKHARVSDVLRNTFEKRFTYVRG